MALFLTESGPFDTIVAWGKGFGTLLAFAMQMSLIVITGYALATTPICTRLISSVCNKPNSATGFYIYAVILSAIGFYLNWGFGLVFAALHFKKFGYTGIEKRI